MIKKLKLWLAVSLATIAISAAVIISLGFNLGVDFTGGSLLTLAGEVTSLSEVAEVVRTELEVEPTVSRGEETQYFIRTKELNEDEHQQLLTALTEAELLAEESSFESIGPTIGAELRKKAVIALLLVAAAVVIYLAYTFRQAVGLIAGWKFGLAALYALLHDLLVVTALFTILGRFKDVPIDTLFVTAMLALLGFSVNDTIVIFNRLKNDWLRQREENLTVALDEAARGSLTRSMNTSLTTLLVLLALLWLGGSSLTWFLVALIAGTVVGTYSSLFVAPPLLYYLARRS